MGEAGPVGAAADGLRRALAWGEGKLADPRVCAAAVFAGAAAVFIVRLPAALERPAGGIDYGHYLATAHWLLGQEPTQFGHEAPFGYHAILAVLIQLMAEPTATAVSGPLVAALLVPAGFVLARKAMPALAALACGGLLASAQNISDMIAWGGNPNLVALACSLAAWRFVIEALGALKDPKPSLRPAMLAGLFIGLTLLSHFFAAFITLVTMGGFLGLGAVLRFFPLRPLLKPLLFASVVAGLAAAPAAPLYYTLLSQGSLSPSLDSVASAQTSVTSILYLNRDTSLLWLAAGALAAFGAAALLAKKNLFGLYLVVGAMVPLALALTLLSPHATRTLCTVRRACTA